MNVGAIADQFCGDLLGLEHRPSEARRAMVDRRHPVEQMRRLSGPGRDGRGRLLERRRRMPQRDAMAAPGEPANQLEAAIQLRRQRDDADVGRRAFDLGEDARPP